MDKTDQKANSKMASNMVDTKTNTNNTKAVMDTKTAPGISTLGGIQTPGTPTIVPSELGIIPFEKLYTNEKEANGISKNFGPTTTFVQLRKWFRYRQSVRAYQKINNIQVQNFDGESDESILRKAKLNPLLYDWLFQYQIPRLINPTLAYEIELTLKMEPFRSQWHALRVLMLKIQAFSIKHIIPRLVPDSEEKMVDLLNRNIPEYELNSLMQLKDYGYNGYGDSMLNDNEKNFIKYLENIAVRENWTSIEYLTYNVDGVSFHGHISLVDGKGISIFDAHCLVAFRPWIIKFAVLNKWNLYQTVFPEQESIMSGLNMTIDKNDFVLQQVLKFPYENRYPDWFAVVLRSTHDSLGSSSRFPLTFETDDTVEDYMYNHRTTPIRIYRMNSNWEKFKLVTPFVHEMVKFLTLYANQYENTVFRIEVIGDVCFHTLPIYLSPNDARFVHIFQLANARFNSVNTNTALRSVRQTTKEKTTMIDILNKSGVRNFGIADQYSSTNPVHKEDRFWSILCLIPVTGWSVWTPFASHAPGSIVEYHNVLYVATQVHVIDLKEPPPFDGKKLNVGWNNFDYRNIKFEVLPLSLILTNDSIHIRTIPLSMAQGSTFRCMSVKVSFGEFELNNRIEVGSLVSQLPLIDAATTPQKMNSPKQSTIADVEYISADGGCRYLILSPNNKGGAFLQCAKLFCSAFDVDVVNLQDAAKGTCMINKDTQVYDALPLRIIFGLRMSMSWYNRQGFALGVGFAEVNWFFRTLSDLPPKVTSEMYSQFFMSKENPNQTSQIVRDDYRNRSVWMALDMFNMIAQMRSYTTTRAVFLELCEKYCSAASILFAPFQDNSLSDVNDEDYDDDDDDAKNQETKEKTERQYSFVTMMHIWMKMGIRIPFSSLKVVESVTSNFLANNNGTVMNVWLRRMPEKITQYIQNYTMSLGQRARKFL